MLSLKGEKISHTLIANYAASNKMECAPDASCAPEQTDGARPSRRNQLMQLGEASFENAMKHASNPAMFRIYSDTAFKCLNKIIETNDGQESKHDSRLSKLSSDEVFSKLVIPVLLTYESTTVQQHTIDSARYRNELLEELKKHSSTFREKDLPQNVEIVLILVPLHTKKVLAETLHTKLTSLQAGL